MADNSTDIADVLARTQAVIEAILKEVTGSRTDGDVRIMFPAGINDIYANVELPGNIKIEIEISAASQLHAAKSDEAKHGESSGSGQTTFSLVRPMLINPVNSGGTCTVTKKKGGIVTVQSGSAEGLDID